MAPSAGAAPPTRSQLMLQLKGPTYALSTTLHINLFFSCSADRPDISTQPDVLYCKATVLNCFTCCSLPFLTLCWPPGLSPAPVVPAVYCGSMVILQAHTRGSETLKDTNVLGIYYLCPHCMVSKESWSCLPPSLPPLPCLPPLPSLPSSSCCCCCT